jgi:hypothetical protein
LSVSDAGGLLLGTPQASVGLSATVTPRAHGYGGIVATLFIALAFMYDDDGVATAYPSGFSYFTDTQTSGAGANLSASMAIAARRSAGPVATPGNFTLSEAEGWTSFSLVIPAATPDVAPDPGVFFVAEGEASALDGTWSTATASTCRLLVDAGHIGLRTPEEVKLLIAGDLSEPTFTGYSAAALTSGNWTITPGTPTVCEHTPATFVASGDPVDPVFVQGLWVTRNSDGALIYFEVFDGGPFKLEVDADEVTVTPAFTLKGVRST